MAIRKVYRVNEKDGNYVDKIDIEFKWNSGFSVVQKQKNITNLHNEYSKIYKDDKILEISTKSKDELGVRLSAFNLAFLTKNNNAKLTIITSAKLITNFQSLLFILIEILTSNYFIVISIPYSFTIIIFNYFLTFFYTT